MDKQKRCIIDGAYAWIYHARGSDNTPVYRRENHDVVLDPSTEWCITHRPATTCQCGTYRLEWQS